MNCMNIVKNSCRVVALSLVMVASAFALSLGDAKSQGLIGETSTGYIAAVKPSGEVKALVDSINSQRKAHYQKIAKKNNISMEAVEVRAGQKAIGKTAAGHYVNTGGGWQKK